MNGEHYRARLQDLEKSLIARIEREKQEGRDQFIDVPADVAELGAAEESAAEEFSAAAVDTRMLGQVREALQRIDGGTFGRCVVDGGPIEAARLEAMPWTPCCLRHQQALEDSAPSATRL
jgi:DnaK suppressor protein